MATQLPPFVVALIGAEHSDDLFRKTLFRMRPWWKASTRPEGSDEEALSAIKSEAFNLLWSDSLFVGRSPVFGLLNPTTSSPRPGGAEYQLVNHFPNNQVLVSKAALLRTVHGMCRAQAAAAAETAGTALAGGQASASPLHLFDVCPVSFMIPGGGELDDNATWKSFALRYMRIADNPDPAAPAIRCPPKHCAGNLWLTKPVRGADGHDMTVWSSLTALKSHLEASEGEWLVQKVIERPLLAYGRKVSLRSFVLVTDAMDVYTWNAPFFNLATALYTPVGFSGEGGSAPQGDVAAVQVTSTAQQASVPGYGQHPLPLGNIMYFDEMNKYLNSENKSLPANALYTHVLPALRALCVDVVRAAAPELRKGCGGRRCFELFAVDVLVDEDLRLWLLDFAENPNLDTATDRQEALVNTVFAQALALAVDPLFPAPTVQAEARRALAVGNRQGACGVIRGTEAFGIAPAAQGASALAAAHTAPLPAAPPLLIGTLGGAAGCREYWSRLAAGASEPPSGVDSIAVGAAVTTTGTEPPPSGHPDAPPLPIAAGFELAFRVADVPDVEPLPQALLKEVRVQAEQAPRVPDSLDPFLVLPPASVLPRAPLGSRVTEAALPPRARNAVPWYGIPPPPKDRFVKLADPGASGGGEGALVPSPPPPGSTPPPHPLSSPERGGGGVSPAREGGRAPPPTALALTPPSTPPGRRAGSPGPPAALRSGSPSRTLLRDGQGRPLAGVASPPPPPTHRPPPPGASSVAGSDIGGEAAPDSPRVEEGRGGVQARAHPPLAPVQEAPALPPAPIRPDGPAGRANALLARLEAAAGTPGAKPVNPALLAHLRHAVQLLTAAETVAAARGALQELEGGEPAHSSPVPPAQASQQAASPGHKPHKEGRRGGNFRSPYAAPGSATSTSRSFSRVYGGHRGVTPELGPGSHPQVQRSPRARAAAAARAKAARRAAAARAAAATPTGRLAQSRGGSTASARAARQLARAQRHEARQRAVSPVSGPGSGGEGETPTERSTVRGRSSQGVSPTRQYAGALQTKLVEEVDAEVARVTQEVAARSSELAQRQAALDEREAALAAAEARLAAAAASMPGPYYAPSSAGSPGLESTLPRGGGSRDASASPSASDSDSGGDSDSDSSVVQPRDGAPVEVWVEVPSAQHGGTPYYYHAVSRDTRWRRPNGPGIIVLAQDELETAAATAQEAVHSAAAAAAAGPSYGGMAATPHQVYSAQHPAPFVLHQPYMAAHESRGYGHESPFSHTAHSPGGPPGWHHAPTEAASGVFRVPGAGTLGSGSIRFDGEQSSGGAGLSRHGGAHAPAYGGGSHDSSRYSYRAPDVHVRLH